MVHTLELANQSALSGEMAPDFSLPSVQGSSVSLANYRQQSQVILWFSRGMTCNFCRGYMDNIIVHYDTLLDHGIEVIQIAPNLLESARRFFVEPPPYPFVCDPDKRLYAVYGMGDRGVLEAARNAVVSHSISAVSGELGTTLRGSALDIFNRNFLRRLHHHALTAVEQGIFLIDKTSVIRYAQRLGAIEKIPTGEDLLALAQEHLVL